MAAHVLPQPWAVPGAAPHRSRCAHTDLPELLPSPPAPLSPAGARCQAVRQPRHRWAHPISRLRQPWQCGCQQCCGGFHPELPGRPVGGIPVPGCRQPVTRPLGWLAGSEVSAPQHGLQRGGRGNSGAATADGGGHTCMHRESAEAAAPDAASARPRSPLPAATPKSGSRRPMRQALRCAWLWRSSTPAVRWCKTRCGWCTTRSPGAVPPPPGSPACGTRGGRLMPPSQGSPLGAWNGTVRRSRSAPRSGGAPWPPQRQWTKSSSM